MGGWRTGACPGGWPPTTAGDGVRIWRVGGGGALNEDQNRALPRRLGPGLDRGAGAPTVRASAGDGIPVYIENSHAGLQSRPGGAGEAVFRKALYEPLFAAAGTPARPRRSRGVRAGLAIIGKAKGIVARPSGGWT